MQQCFGRNTAHVEAGAAQGFPPFNTGCFKSQLSASDRRNIAPGPAANHNYIIARHCYFLSQRGGYFPPKPSVVLSFTLKIHQQAPGIFKRLFHAD